MPDDRALIRLARRHLGEPYILGAKVPKNNASWRGPWDCAEFTSWCAFQLTGTLFGCRPGSAAPDIADAYTGFWMDDARAMGRIVTVGQAVATPGAFLLRAPRAGTIGHVVISQGNGRTVEAHSTARGVIEGGVNGRRWSVGLLVPGIDVHVRD
jgi:cell wall-associated NlpC family hydrolase